MRNFSKRCKAVLLCAAVGTTSFFGLTACKKENPESTLYIDISNAGYGIQWLNPLVDIFENEHSEIKVKVRDVVKNDGNYVQKCLSGTADTDLFFVETTVLKYIDTPVETNQGMRFEHPFMDLTELYNEKIPGEKKSIAEKMRPEYLAFNTVEGKNYTFPWMESMMGFVMNKSVYKESWGKLPNTTDELFKFCDKVKSDGYSPFIYSTADPYYLDIYSLWMAQYHGQAEMTKFYDGYAVSGPAKGERYMPEMFLDDGLLAALEVLDRIVNYDNGYQDKLSYTLSFTDAQNRFLDPDNKTLFMADGAWMQREMEMNYTPEEINVEFVRMPVVSALGKKLGITDSELSQIIDYVDGTVAEAPEFTSAKGLERQAVLDEVTAARKMVPSNHLHAAFIPSYSAKVDYAKEFIWLMASDRGIKAMLKETQLKPPMEFNVLEESNEIELSRFMNSVYALADSSVYNVYAQGALFRKGGLELVNNQGYFTQQMGAPNPDDRKDASKIFGDNYQYVSDYSHWQSFLNSAGIIE